MEQMGLAKRFLQRYNTQNNSCEKRFLTGTAIAAASGEGPFYVDRLGSLFTEIQKGHPMHWGCLFCSAPPAQYIQESIQPALSQASRFVRNTASPIHFVRFVHNIH